MNILILHIGGAIVSLIVCIVMWYAIFAGNVSFLLHGKRTLPLLTFFQIITGVFLAWSNTTLTVLGTCARLGIYIGLVGFTYFVAHLKIQNISLQRREV